MIKTDELISEAISLPSDIKTRIIDQLLLSMNPERTEIDKFWKEEAELRVGEIKAHKVTAVRGEEVFKEIKKRFKK